MSINADEKSETFDFTVLNERADNLRERNRIIAQDSNGLYREFIVTHVVDNFDGTTEIESNASYLEDIGSSKPIKPGKYSAYSTTQALNETLRNTGWELSDDTEHGGMRTTSWTSYVTPYELINQLCTTYSMVADYYIELSSHTVEHRYVSLKKPVSLFKGKEITKGKDLTGMTRTVDMSEVRTALYAVGPEKEKGERLEKIVTDDDAQMQFGLPGRYLWSVYEPESDDENMTLERLTTLAKTELNKRNKSAISYEIGSTDIHKFYKDITISLHDTVRVKDRDFRPPLYLDAEVIAIDYDLLNDESTYKFGNVVEYEESKLRDAFNKRFDAINKKLNDSITNINTIVNETIAGELEYYERKIIKSNTSPENPVNDMLWYDTSNPDVAVLRRYWNGKWITQTADDVEKIGGLRREQVMYRDLNNSFINLTIQHSKLQNDVYDVLNSEYLVEDDLKANLNQALSDVDGVYQNIKTNLDSMDEDTATIGKLVDTQTLFTVYREKLQTLYKCVTDAKVSIDKRLKLLQSQYTDEKFNDAMQNVATGIGGTWNAETGQLFADIPSQQELEDALKIYINGQDEALKQLIDGEVNSKIIQTKDELSSNISEVSAKVDGIQVGGRNLVLKSDVLYSNSNYLIADYTLSKPMEVGKTYTITVKGNVENSNGGLAILRDNGRYFITSNADKISDELYKVTFEANKDTFITDNIRLYNYPIDTLVRSNIEWIKLEEGNIPTDWTPAPEDTQKAAQAYTDEMLEPITSTQIQQSSDIKQLKDGFTLKADKKDITTLYDNNIAPLERQVNNNSSELKIQSNKIDSKVSNEQYTADVDDIISKLNSAESQRIQLSNQIADKVSLIEYKNGIDSVKSTNRNYLQSYYSATQNSTSGTTKGPYNIGLNAYQRINFYFYNRDNNSNIPLKQDTDYILKIHESSSDIKVGIFYKRGSYTIAGYTTDKIIRFNTGDREDFLIVALSQSNDQYIGKISLYEGTKELDWSPAPEDIELLGLTAENNAKSYIDDYKNKNETKLKLMNTEINQNGREIQLKASQEDFNASRKTLSQVISEISATTKGINLSYDENGNIQSYTMDRNGIQLRGDKVDITVNKDFNVMASKVDDKVGKDEVINRLNLSPEGLDINVNNIGIRGGDSKTYLKLSQDTMELAGTFNRTWRGDIQKDNVYMRAQGGLLRFRNNTRDRSLYYSDFGISTYVDGNNEEASGSLQFFDYTYSTARGVTLNSSNGVAAVTSDNNRVILSANLTVNIESNYSIYFRPNRDNRTGNNEFAMYVKLNDSGADTDGVLKYGNVSSDTSQYGSGLRFSKSSVRSILYATNKDGDIGTGDFYGDKIYGDLTAKSTNAYVLVDGALRVTDTKGYNGDNTNYRDIQCKDIASNTIRTRVGRDFYIGVSTNELRVTNNLFWNGGDTGYKPVRASAFNNASLEQYKTDIKKWDYDALTVIANDLDLYQFKYKNEEGKEKGLNHRGVVIGRDYKTPDEFIYGDGVNLYEMVTWSLRAIQQLNEKINKLEEQLNEQPITS
nr:phage tail spike protein [Staphylococcus haemolyticus]